MEENLETFTDRVLDEALKELQEQHQINFPQDAINQLKYNLTSSSMSREEIVDYVRRRKNEIIDRQREEREVKSGERPSNFGDIVNTVETLFSDEALSSKLSIYGGTIPYLMTGEQPRRMIGDIDTHVSMHDMQQVRKIIASNPSKYKIISDTLQATGKEYGFEMLVDGVTVSVFPTIEDERGMVVNNFHQNELENTMELVSTIFYGVDERNEIETINVNGIGVRIMSPKFTYITKGVAGRPKDIEDMKVLEKVIRPEKIEQMKQSMKKPDRVAEVINLASKEDVDVVLQSAIEATEGVSKSTIDEQAMKIEQLVEAKDEKLKGTVIE